MEFKEELENFRMKMNSLDQMIVEALLLRRQLSQQIQNLKMKQGLACEDVGREQEIRARITSGLGAEEAVYLNKVYTIILSSSLMQ